MIKFHNLLFALVLFFGCSQPQEFQEISNPASDNSRYPRLFTDNTGTLFMSWYEADEDLTTLKYSKFEEGIWSIPITISSSDSWFVNWADFPSIIAINGDVLAAHWLAKIPGNTYSYQIMIGSTSDSDLPPITAHNDNTPTEHGFVSMLPTSDTTFYAIWLDGRFTGSTGGHDMHNSSSEEKKFMTIRGAEFNSNLEKISEQEIDHTTCDCCNTTLDITPNGLIAAYRDRSEDEIRDIYTTRFVNGAWTSPKPVYNDGWEIDGCPVNGPMLSTLGNSVALAWFTGVNDIPTVKLSFSNNGGEDFDSPITLESETPIGRVDVLMTEENSAWVSWLSRVDEHAEIVVREISSTGKTLNEFLITPVDGSRSMGFPQLSLSDENLVLAWTDPSGNQPVVKTAILK